MWGGADLMQRGQLQLALLMLYFERMYDSASDLVSAGMRSTILCPLLFVTTQSQDGEAPTQKILPSLSSQNADAGMGRQAEKMAVAVHRRNTDFLIRVMAFL